MKLLFKYLSMHLKISLEYKLSFILSLISQILAMFIELFVVLSLLTKFNMLKNFNYYEVIIGFSTVWCGYSFAELFGRGFDHFKNLMSKGDFDILLIRPRSIIIQVFGSDIAYQKLGKAIISLGLFIYASIHILDNFSFLKILLLIFMLIGSFIMILSILIIGAVFCFKTIKNLEFVNIFTNGTRNIGNYPMGIYNKVVRKIFTFIIPLSLLNYYPLEYLSGRTTNILYVFMPLLIWILFALSIFIFNKGIKYYCSTGS